MSQRTPLTSPLQPRQFFLSYRLKRFVFKATANEAGPGFAVVETLLYPVAAAPAHVHDNTDEAVYVIDGRLMLEVVASASTLFPDRSRSCHGGCHTGVS
jgi:Cupin domain.